MTTLHYNCPECLRNVRYPAQQQGRSIKCPSCKRPIKLPGSPKIRIPEPIAVKPKQDRLRKSLVDLSNSKQKDWWGWLMVLLLGPFGVMFWSVPLGIIAVFVCLTIMAMSTTNEVTFGLSFCFCYLYTIVWAISTQQKFFKPGLGLAIAGVIHGFFFFFVFDATFKGNYNIGLLNQRLMGIVWSAGMFFTGISRYSVFEFMEKSNISVI